MEQRWLVKHYLILLSTKCVILGNLVQVLLGAFTKGLEFLICISRQE